MGGDIDTLPESCGCSSLADGGGGSRDLCLSLVLSRVLWYGREVWEGAQ